MSALQKFAWFNLAVVALAVGTVAALLPLLGKGALGGTGFLGLLGLGVLFFRQRPGQVLTDERDHLIQRRSWVLAFATFWVVYVFAAAFLAPAVYGQEGGVPVWVVQASVFGGMALVYAVGSVAILAQYAGGTRDAG